MGKASVFLLSVSSALFITAAFLPALNAGILVWFGLSPLLFALRQRGMLAGAGLGFLFGSILAAGSSLWIFSVYPTTASKILMIIYPSLYYLVFGLLYRLTSTTIGSWTIVGAPALWVALEYMRSNLFFLSFPWHLLGHSQYRNLSVIQIADFAGVYGISFLVVMVNQCLSQVPDLLGHRIGYQPLRSIIGRNYVLETAIVVLVLMLVIVYGWRRTGGQTGSEWLRVALIQANVVPTDDMSAADQKEHLSAYEPLTREAAKSRPALIAWPTSSLPVPIHLSRYVRQTVTGLARETRSYLLVGGAGYEKIRPLKKEDLPFSNSEYLINPSGRIEGRYDKMILLPFNEYLPLEGKITWPRWITALKKSFIPGEKYTLFQVSGARFGTPICWENMFPSHFRQFVKDGARFMVSVTNDEFYGRTAAPYQTLAMNVFRAVENRVAVVRPATTGVSAFINPDGEIVGRVRDSNGEDLFVPGILVRDVPLSKTKTFFTIYGDIFAYTTIGVAVLIILVSLYVQIRPRSQPRISDDRN